MTNKELFSAKIEKQGIPIAELSRRSGVSRKRIYAIKEGADATASEISALSRALLLSEDEMVDIFLAGNVSKRD